MPRSRKDLIGKTIFHHFPFFHHQYFMTEGFDDFQVMADEDIGQTILFLQVLEQLDHLKLYGTVQGRGRFIQNNEIGLQHQARAMAMR